MSTYGLGGAGLTGLGLSMKRDAMNNANQVASMEAQRNANNKAAREAERAGKAQLGSMLNPKSAPSRYSTLAGLSNVSTRQFLNTRASLLRRYWPSQTCWYLS